jgi:transposase
MGKRKSTQYTKEFRQSSAKHAVESDQSIGVTAINLGIHETTLYSWVAKYYPDRNKRQETDTQLNPDDELKRLKKELKRVTMERDILKKAAAYFAGETL